jgi:curli biogenesis system outer membrane secretion channel CsgG
MKIIIVLIPLLAISCAASNVSVNREALKSAKTVAIIPFTSSIQLKKEITAEAEESFRTAFIRLNYRVAEKEKLNQILKNSELTSPDLTGESIKKIGLLSGSDAVLTGEIISHGEVRREVRRHIFGSFVFHEDHGETETKTYFKFQIVVKLINASDGSVILTVKNRFPEAEQDEYLPAYKSLDSYRSHILDKMKDELIQAANKKN